MAKCIRCGGGFFTCRKIKLSDSYICGRCIKELGFDKDFYLTSSLHSYDEIKDGYAAYSANQLKEYIKDDVISSISVTVTGAGRERDLVCTEEERQIYEMISKAADVFGADLEALRLVRVSDDYVTAKLGDWDLARIKYTNRAKWVIYPTAESGSVKHYIEDPEDLREHLDLIRDSIEIISKYS